MDMNAITQLIGTVGFPICVSLVCFWYINKQAASHKAEIDGLREALTNNTIVMQRLVDHLEGKDDK